MTVFEKLNKTKQRNLEKYEIKKIGEELKECSFKPSIARKSVKMAMKAFKTQSGVSGLSSSVRPPSTRSR